MFWYLDWRLQSGGGSYWHFTWKLSSVHIVSKQPGRTPTLWFEEKCFLGSLSQNPPPPLSWESFRNLPLYLGLFHKLGCYRWTWIYPVDVIFAPPALWEEHPVKGMSLENFCFNCHFICIASAAERKHIFFTFTTIMIIINIHLMISIMFTSWSS